MKRRSAAALACVAALAGAHGGGPYRGPGELVPPLSEVRPDELSEFFEAERDAAAYAARYREGFDAFIERMDAFDGPGSVRLARAMHARADSIWSAFCLEGALRRSAPADADRWSEAFREADAVLVRLLESGEAGKPLTDAAHVDVVQRRAILAFGFGARDVERGHLGAALAARGVDGAQISGLAALVAGDHAAAQRLFGSLLRSDQPASEAPAWALRGHSLAALAALTDASH